MAAKGENVMAKKREVNKRTYEKVRKEIVKNLKKAYRDLGWLVGVSANHHQTTIANIASHLHKSLNQMEMIKDGWLETMSNPRRRRRRKR